MTQDIRWQQRFSNFNAALDSLTEDMSILKTRKLNKTEEKGLIQSFEYTYELGWKCLKDFCKARGVTDIIGSKDAIRYAFKTGLIENGEIWMDMVKNRVLTVHTYNREIAKKIVGKIINNYYPEFINLREILTKFMDET